MAHDVAKYILHHVESDNLSKLKKIYLCKYYRFNNQLEQYLYDSICKGANYFSIDTFMRNIVPNHSQILFATHIENFGAFTIHGEQICEKLDLKSRLYTNEYGETTETSKVEIGFADKKMRDVFMSFIERNDLRLLCYASVVIVSWEHWKLNE